MRDLGSRVLESRGEESGLVMVVIWFLGKEGLSKECRLRRGHRDEETRAARSRKGRSFEYQRQNMQIYSPNL